MEPTRLLKGVFEKSLSRKHTAETLPHILEPFRLYLQIADETIICVKTRCSNNIRGDSPLTGITTTSMGSLKEYDAAR